MIYEPTVSWSSKNKNKNKKNIFFLFLFLKLQLTVKSQGLSFKKVSFSSGGRAQALWVVLLVCVYVHVL